jgi:basic membrane protein A and related proteins
MRFLLRFSPLALGAVLLTSCANGDAASGPRTVTVLFSGGGRGDHGFNDEAVAGAERAQKDFGVHVRFVDPSGEDETAMANAAAQDGADMVVGIGFLFSEPLRKVAPSFPRTRFVGIDMASSNDASGKQNPLPTNVAGIAFREDEGAFLVGALAAMASQSHAVGFVGGMRSDLVKRFEDGYGSGAHYVCPTCRVIVDYVGDTRAAFAEPEKAAALAKAEFTAGADVIFHAAGKSGKGVIAGAMRSGYLAIGADIDQEPLAPGHVLTSMRKEVDVAVYEAIKRAHEGHLETGTITTLGLAQNGVGYVYNDGNRLLISPAMHARAEQLRASIASGQMTTHQKPGSTPTT